MNILWKCFITGLLLLIGCSEMKLPVGRNGPYTVVLVTLDTLRADRLGAYGGRRDISPNFDRLTSGGALYTRAYSAAPWTLPSHATIFTGLDPAEHGCHHGTLRFDGRVPLLAERFRESGYATGGFSNNPWVSGSTGLSAGFDVYVEIFRRSVSAGMAINRFIDPVKIGLKDAGAARTVAAVNQWLDEVGNRRVFLFVNFIETHLPYDPPEGWRGRYHDSPLLLSEAHRFIINWLSDAHRNGLRDEDRAEAMRLYDEEISYVDFQLGQLMDTLAKHERLKDALIVVTSDHGEAFGEHRTDGIQLVDHQLSAYDELLRVPLVIQWPGHFGKGETYTEPVSLADLYPLFAWALEGQKEPLPVLMTPGNPDRVLRACYHPPHSHREILEHYLTDKNTIDRLTARGFRAVRRGNFKLIAPNDGPPLLFSILSDPDEKLDVSDQYPSVVSELFGLLPPTLQGGDATAPPDTLDALRALGYIE